MVGWSGWWTEAAFGSVWLAVIGVHSSRSPAVMADRMTLSTFPLPSIMCVCVSMSEWRQTHLGGHTTGDGDADNVHRGCVCVGSQGVSVTINGCSISFGRVITRVSD